MRSEQLSIFSHIPVHEAGKPVYEDKINGNILNKDILKAHGKDEPTLKLSQRTLKRTSSKQISFKENIKSIHQKQSKNPVTGSLTLKTYVKNQSQGVNTGASQIGWKAITKALPASHGGVKSKGKRKTQRPLIPGKWIHLTLKSDKAYGKYSFLALKNQIYIKTLLSLKAKQFNITIGDFVNMGNHLHLKIKTPSRETFQKFLRSITNLIARTITQARRGHKFGRFWQGLAYTRILKSSLEALQLKGYFQANREERRLGKKARESCLADFNKWIYQLRYRQKQFL